MEEQGGREGPLLLLAEGDRLNFSLTSLCLLLSLSVPLSSRGKANVKNLYSHLSLSLLCCLPLTSLSLSPLCLSLFSSLCSVRMGRKSLCLVEGVLLTACISITLRPRCLSASSALPLSCLCYSLLCLCHANMACCLPTLYASLTLTAISLASMEGSLGTSLSPLSHSFSLCDSASLSAMPAIWDSPGALFSCLSTAATTHCLTHSLITISHCFLAWEEGRPGCLLLCHSHSHWEGRGGAGGISPPPLSPLPLRQAVWASLR